MSRSARLVLRAFFNKVGLGGPYGECVALGRAFQFLCLHLLLRLLYLRTIYRIRHYPITRKIKVGFLVDNISKWKSQSLYDELKKSGRFDPVMILSAHDYDFQVLSRDELIEKLDRDEQYFKSLGNECIVAIDVSTGERIPLRQYPLDIVFFQEPGVGGLDAVSDAARMALTCYIPYSIEPFQIRKGHVPEFFYGRLFLLVALDNVDAEYWQGWLPYLKRSGLILGLGHTILDTLSSAMAKPSPRERKPYVIYAPHFSVPSVTAGYRQLNLSTFLDVGRSVLEFAEQHPEIDWAFKPHPRLRKELVTSGQWTEDEVNQYYSAWEKIGDSCYTSSYQGLFEKSTCMITDSASFLLEYGFTGKPLIRLIPPHCNGVPRPSFRDLFDSYYNVRTVDELIAVLNDVVINKNDSKAKKRNDALGCSGLISDSPSSRRILQYLEHVILVKA